MTSQAMKEPRTVAAHQSLRPVRIDAKATYGAQIGVNLLLPDGTVGTLAKLQALFGAAATSNTEGSTIDTTDDLEEGQFNQWFTDERAQNAVGAILAGSSTIDLAYTTGTSITATLKDLADSGVGTALVKITRDSKGRISGTSAATTTDLAEGANLYYSDARADARISAQKGLANGLAPLGSDGKLDTAYLPVAVLGQVDYQGTWDASAGTPPTTTPDKGWYYIVTVAGSTALDGITDWAVGDWAIYDGSAWAKVDNTDAVVTVNGYTGAVTLTAADVGAATTAQGAKADSAVQPGGNVSVLLNDAGYLTDAPSDGQQYARQDGGWVVVTGGGGGSGDVVGPASAADGDVALFDGTTGKLLKDAGGSFGALVRAALLTGLSTATSVVITAADSVLAAFGKLQAQITDNLLPKGYIDGLRLVWVSSTALTVTSGAAYIESTGKVLRATSDIAKAGLSLAASTTYHLYLYDNAGTPAVEVVTTAPAAAFNGTARSKTGDTTRRYLGSFITDSAGSLLPFVHTGDDFLYPAVKTSAPFRVLANGTATSPTTVDMSASVPTTATAAHLRVFNQNNVNVSLIATGFGTVTAALYSMRVQTGLIFGAPLPLGSAKSFDYALDTTGTGGLYVDVTGYRVAR